MKGFLIVTACLFAAISTAHAAQHDKAHKEVRAQKHAPTAVVRHPVPRPPKPVGGYDQNHGAYDPWYWDPSYGR
jgi:hypothetical protein